MSISLVQGAPAVVVLSQDVNGAQQWMFDETVHLPVPLPMPTTCDIELQLPAGYQAVDVQGPENMTVVNAAHIRYEDVLPGTCVGNVFQVSKPIAATWTTLTHFFQSPIYFSA